MMKMKCNRRDLVEAVSLVEKAVPVSTPISVLEGIFIEAKENAFKLVGNNMDLKKEELLNIIIMIWHIMRLQLMKSALK